MKFEKLNESSGKSRKMFLYGFLMCVVLLIIINMFLTKAKYKVVDSAKLVESNINYKIPDLNVIAMYKKEDDIGDYELVEEIPTGDYELSEESYCVVKDSKEKIYNVMEYKENKVYIGINKMGTKCYVYLKKAKPLTSKDTLAKLPSLTVSQTGCPITDDEGNAKITAISQPSDNLLCKAQDDYGETYYFRGNVDNNWVQIGYTYWRIIRINGDGTIRVIYNGITTDMTGKSTMAFYDQSNQTNKTYAYNASRDDNAYVGFMYGKTSQKKDSSTTPYDNTHANSTSSNILTQLETWINGSEFPQQYLEILDGHAGFCNDRSPYKYSGLQTTDKQDKINYGMGNIATYYGPYYRINKTTKPTFKCPNAKNDLFTTVGNENGNEKLQYAVGLITADEVEYAGAYQLNSNTSYYLCNGEYYWTMSPYYFSGSAASVLYVYNNGGFFAPDVNANIIGIRPVINLKADAPFIEGGDGTSSKPFTVKLN